MTETERLAATIDKFERERAQLQADLVALESQQQSARVADDAALAEAERSPSPTTIARAENAEQQRLALESQLRRKGAALAACERDLQTARQALAASKKAAQFVQIQAALDDITVAAAAIDDDPTYVQNWATLKELVTRAQTLYAVAGGGGRFVEDPAAVRARLWGALGVQVDFALGVRREELKPVPAMADLLGLRSAAGRVRELLGVA